MLFSENDAVLCEFLCELLPRGSHSPRKLLRRMAGSTGLEPAASAVTGQRSNQLNYDPACAVVVPLRGRVTCWFARRVTGVVGSAGLEPATSCL